MPRSAYPDYIYDLTHTQFVILASSYWLSTHIDAVTQVDVADFVDIDKIMTSNVLRKLIEKELIIRTEHETDTRAKVIHLTTEGITTLKQALFKIEAFDRQFFAQLHNKKLFNSELIALLNSGKS